MLHWSSSHTVCSLSSHGLWGPKTTYRHYYSGCPRANCLSPYDRRVASRRCRVVSGESKGQITAPNIIFVRSTSQRLCWLANSRRKFHAQFQTPYFSPSLAHQRRNSQTPYSAPSLAQPNSPLRIEVESEGGRAPSDGAQGCRAAASRFGRPFVWLRFIHLFPIELVP